MADDKRQLRIQPSEEAKRKLVSAIRRTDWDCAVDTLKFNGFVDGSDVGFMMVLDNGHLVLSGVIESRNDLRVMLVDDFVAQRDALKEQEFRTLFSNPNWKFHDDEVLIGKLVAQAMVNDRAGMKNPCLEAIWELIPAGERATPE